MLTTKKQILFVDDDPAVLNGIRKIFQQMGEVWELQTATSGAEALEFLARKPVDIVVSDMRMPEMDGLQLLHAVKFRYPRVRFILADQADREMMGHFIGSSHRFLAKPYNPSALKTTLDRVAALQEMLPYQKLHELIPHSESLPSLPAIYDRLTRALNSANSSTKEIGALIGEDMAMTGNVLHLVNSAFFGLRCRVENITQAVILLGVEMMKALVLTAGVFDKFSPKEVAEFHLQTLREHSILTGQLSQQLSQLLQCDENMANDALLAGMIHDIGKLILVRNYHDDYLAVCQRHQREGKPLHELEKEVFGVNHAQMGAYLLGLWGLPENIIEAVAFHHEPARSRQQEISIVTIAHVANVLAYGNASDDKLTNLDMPYLTEIGLDETKVNDLVAQISVKASCY